MPPRQCGSLRRSPEVVSMPDLRRILHHRKGMVVKIIDIAFLLIFISQPCSDSPALGKVFHVGVIRLRLIGKQKVRNGIISVLHHRPDTDVVEKCTCVSRKVAQKACRIINDACMGRGTDRSGN